MSRDIEKMRKAKREHMRRWRAANPAASRELDRQWHLAHPEKAPAYRKANAEKRTKDLRAWHAANPTKKKEYDRKYREAHSEKVNARQRAYYEANKEAVGATQRKWREDNTEKVQGHKQNRRAIKRGAEGSHTARDTALIMQRQEHRCTYCKADLRKVGQHLDHVMPLALGGSNWPCNLQYLCPPCNLSKGAKHPDQFTKEHTAL